MKDRKLCIGCKKYFYRKEKNISKNRFYVMKYCSYRCYRPGENIYDIKENVLYIYYKGKKIICDLENKDEILLIKWSFDSEGYVCGTVKRTGKMIRLHNLIMKNRLKGFVIDHINRNKLDNRKCNLRFVTRSLNIFNQRTRNIYNGIYFDKSKNKWDARIKCKNKRYYLGCYKDLKEAIKIRREAEIKLFGEHSKR